MTAPASADAQDRALAAFRGLVLSVYPAAVYWLTHEYAVAESDGATFSGTPTDATISPQLPTRVPYAPSLAGASCVVPVGTLAYVGFANADPSKPFLVRFGAGSTSTAVSLAAGTVTLSIGGELKHVVCYGDNITVPVGGGAAAGPIIQNPATAPNAVSLVTAQ